MYGHVFVQETALSPYEGTGAPLNTYNHASIITDTYEYFEYLGSSVVSIAARNKEGSEGPSMGGQYGDHLGIQGVYSLAVYMGYLWHWG